MAQIAAEELGLPLDRVDVSLGDSARGPYAAHLGRLVDDPLDGPGRARSRRTTPRGRSSRSRRSATTSRSASSRSRAATSSRPTAARGRSRRSTGLLEDAQILGKGARGPNPTGMRVLTFGVQVAEVAVDVETGEVRVEQDRRDPRRRPRDQPARRVEPGRGRDHPGHRPHAVRAAAARPGERGHAHADARRLQACRRSPTCPRSSRELVDVPDEHLTNLGSKGLGEPPIIPTAAAIANAIRDATGAEVRSLPITREEMLRALREATEQEKTRGAPAAV